MKLEEIEVGKTYAEFYNGALTKAKFRVTGKGEFRAIGFWTFAHGEVNENESLTHPVNLAPIPVPVKRYVVELRRPREGDRYVYSAEIITESWSRRLEPRFVIVEEL